MTYTNSSLVSCTILSPNHSGQRTHEIDRITPHCVVGQATAERIGRIFSTVNRQASCNYGIGKDGRIVLVVEEKNRSWCSSSRENDQRAITIEVASDATAPYAFTEAAYTGLIALCIDICRRNGKKKLLWLGDKEKTLSYTPAPDEMLLSVHRWFANKSCPGNWMYARMGDLASKVTAALGTHSSLDHTTVDNDQDVPAVTQNAPSATQNAPATTQNAPVATQNAPATAQNIPAADEHTMNSNASTIADSATIQNEAGTFPFRVRTPDLAIYKVPGSSPTGKTTGKGVFTIVQVQDGYAKLKSGAGWILLSECTML